MGMTLAKIKKFFSREEFYKNYYSYVILTFKLKELIYNLEKMDYYAMKFKYKHFFRIFITIPDIKITFDERENTYIKLKESYEKIINTIDEATKQSSGYKEYFQYINEERDIEYKNGFLDLIKTITNDLSKVHSNIEEAKNIVISKKF